MTQPELKDSRPRAHGIARLLIIGVMIFAAVVAWLAVLGATAAIRDGHPLIAILTLTGAASWGWMAAGLFHNGTKMRRVALGTALLNTVMPLIGLGLEQPIDPLSPWYRGGEAYWYIPTALCLIVLWWLWYSSPARLARQNG